MSPGARVAAWDERMDADGHDDEDEPEQRR